MFVLQTVFEFTIAILLIVGLFKENKVVEFEDRVVAFIKRRIRARKTATVYRNPVPHPDRRNCA